MSGKGEMYKSKSAAKKHEKSESSKERMMEYGTRKGAVRKAKAKAKKRSK